MEPQRPSPYSIHYDLSNCDEEPLHIINELQNHACLLVCRKNDLTIIQASDNCEEKIGIPYKLALTKKLDELLSTENIEAFSMANSMGDEYLANNPIRMNLPIGIKPNWLNCMVHPQDDLLLLEFEPFESVTLSVGFQHDLGISIQKIQTRSAFNQVLATTAIEVKKITGYDRVMIYQFEKDGHGSVVAEAMESHLEPFLDLHYPASDIPQQARALYLKNPVRIISDVLSVPSKVLPSVTPGTGEPLNMSKVVGRGVSPIHLEYLENMRVRATMSIAIVFDNKLWGLIACHHYASAKFTGFLKRNTAWMLGRIISGHLSLQLANEYRHFTLEANLIKSKLFEQMTADWDIFEGLTQGPKNLLNLNSAAGAALCHEQKLVRLGNTPKEEDILAITDWLDKRQDSFFFHTHELSKVFLPAKNFKEVAAGLLAVRLSNAPGDYILWFKPEKVKTINWGGNPDKAIDRNDKHIRLGPRKSFEKWSQLVQDTAEPWEQYELDTALSLRGDVKDFIFQKYQEAKQFNKELTEAYQELETFSYSVSHDLRAPLRSIDGFANILKEDYGHLLDEEGNLLIDTLLGSAAKLSQFIEDILSYSRMSNWGIKPMSLPLKILVKQVTDELLKTESRTDRNIQLHISDDLPHIHGDRTTMIQLLTNVISNALKYSRHSDPAIIEIGGKNESGRCYFFIKDNGIGFDPKHVEKIFGVFNRLVHDDEYEGTGVGLAIVKRIVEKHKGKLEVDSEPNKGTTFHFYFPTDEVNPA